MTALSFKLRLFLCVTLKVVVPIVFSYRGRKIVQLKNKKNVFVVIRLEEKVKFALILRTANRHLLNVTNLCISHANAKMI